MPRGSLLGPYFGFQNLPLTFDSEGGSIRHAGSAYLRGRLGRGLNYTASYTWSKSIDDGSDAGSSAVANIFASRSDGNVRYGAPLSSDRSVSSFDIPHSITGTFLWDLPVASSSGLLLRHAPASLRHLLGGWTASGTLDASVQKNLYVFGKDSQKRLQLRMDAINVLNHPTFGFASIGGGTGFTSGRGPGTPTQTPITAGSAGPQAGHSRGTRKPTWGWACGPGGPPHKNWMTFG